MDKQKCICTDKKQPSFEHVIMRFSELTEIQRDLARKCREKSMKIDNTEEQPIDYSDEKEQPESIINKLHRIMNRMEENNKLMSWVLSDLENSIM